MIRLNVSFKKLTFSIKHWKTILNPVGYYSPDFSSWQMFSSFSF